MFKQFKSFVKQIKQELLLYRLIAKHPDTPWLAKLCLGFAIGYLLLPFDLIPDFVPILGQLDDLLIVPFFVYAALKLTPNSVIGSCRQQIN
jgi:uncharacterized membrane protein YkvA (DUF1232 family)|tara:strand:- start:11373 stop:11645 length:273 start_codon:yes stop_codon:yes gene_type:complete